MHLARTTAYSSIRKQTFFGPSGWWSGSGNPVANGIRRAVDSQVRGAEARSCVPGLYAKRQFCGATCFLRARSRFCARTNRANSWRDVPMPSREDACRGMLGGRETTAGHNWARANPGGSVSGLPSFLPRRAPFKLWKKIGRKKEGRRSCSERRGRKLQDTRQHEAARRGNGGGGLEREPAWSL